MDSREPRQLQLDYGGLSYVTTIRVSTTRSHYTAAQMDRFAEALAFVALELDGAYDVLVRVHGGGPSGQAGAVRLGVARSLNGVDPELNRPTLKKAGYLTRDARVPERKKAGLKKARKAPQYSKR